MWIVLLTLGVIIGWAAINEYKDVQDLKRKSKRYEEQERP